jgi:hypothetical protein
MNQLKQLGIQRPDYGIFSNSQTLTLWNKMQIRERERQTERQTDREG